MNDLTADAVARALGRAGAQAPPVRFVETTPSTNDDARRAAAEGAPDGAVFLADAQTRGRGRGAHVWHSPPGENVYLSVVLRPQVSLHAIAPITLAIGLAVARSVEPLIGSGAGRAAKVLPSASTAPRAIGLKWPNDVYLQGRKLAGILVEGQIRGDALAFLVAGVGLNVRTERFPPELQSRATSLRLAGATDLDRSAIAAVLARAVLDASRAFEREGLGPCLADIAARDVLAGRRVDVGGVRGIAAGIDGEGRLLVLDEAGVRQAVSSGEVRLLT